MSRTENWDEYPNGRFGDSRSPAYGELDGYGIWIKQTVRSLNNVDVSFLTDGITLLQKEQAHKLWDHPTGLPELAALFSRFCQGNLAALPWSDEKPSSETAVIADQLSRLNEMGFLTINSQPAVDGAQSEDRVFGWGPPNGYVYQKVCRLSVSSVKPSDRT